MLPKGALQKFGVALEAGYQFMFVDSISKSTSATVDLQ